MKKLLFIICLSCILPVYAGLYDDIDRDVAQSKNNIYEQCNKNIECVTAIYNARMKMYDDLIQLHSYSYNAPHQPQSQEIHYGYNAYGEYVPVSVGDRKIKYGYNAYGEYVPISY